jgi:hypothetical protein
MSGASDAFRPLFALLYAGAFFLAGGSPARALPPARLQRQPAVFRPSTQEWVMRNADGSRSVMLLGSPGDQPVPADYAGTGDTQIAVFRTSTAEWLLHRPDGTTMTVPFGEPGDIPVPADYLGLGHAQLAVFRPAAGEWDISRGDGGRVVVRLGAPGDLPVPGDYASLGHVQAAVFRPSTHEWWVRNADGSDSVTPLGETGDIPVPGDYLGLGHAQMAVFHPATAEWLLRSDLGQTTRIPYGMPGDVPVPGDYRGLGADQIVVFRPSTGEWRFRAADGTTTVTPWGQPGDVPVLFLRRSFLIDGVTYVTGDEQETLTATFTRPDGGVTVASYKGYVLLHVAGVGQSDANIYNDAFYLYTGPYGRSPRNGQDGGYYQLAFGTSPLKAFGLANNAENFLVGPLPAYNPDHEYTFILDTTLSSPGHLHFGVSDGGFSDNKGAYTITVTQLVSTP